ncbi:MAG: hypothetical protein NTZ73_03725 [Candidatus Diapherotrites archaeon]|nr:hypothetical protein [Candidatus Diapherotrites archaeon]
MRKPAKRPEPFWGQGPAPRKTGGDTIVSTTFKRVLRLANKSAGASTYLVEHLPNGRKVYPRKGGFFDTGAKRISRQGNVPRNNPALTRRKTPPRGRSR